MDRRQFIQAGGAAALSASSITAAFGQDKTPIKVGVLHSLSGTMAISETTLKDTALMAIEEINAKGGVKGKKLSLKTYDDQGKPEEAAIAATRLINQDKVDFLISPYSSNLTAAAIAVAEPAGVPMVAMPRSGDQPAVL